VPLGSVAEGREVAVVREDLPFDRERAHAGVAFVAERAEFPRRTARPGRRSRDRRANHRCKCHQPSPHMDSFPKLTSTADRTRPPTAEPVPFGGSPSRGSRRTPLGPCPAWAYRPLFVNFPELRIPR